MSSQNQIPSVLKKNIKKKKYKKVKPPYSPKVTKDK